MRLPLQTPLVTPQGPQQELRQAPGPEATGKERLHTKQNTHQMEKIILLQQLYEYLAAELLAGDQAIHQATGTKAGDPAKNTLLDSTVSFLHLLTEGLNR